MGKNMDKNTLLVTFPGFGYLAGRPLFYFAKKLAAQHGFDVLDVAYSDISGEGSVRERAGKSLKGAAADAEGQIREALSGGQYGRIICISKSFGTLVAGSLWDRLYTLLKNECVTQIFLTPLPETYTMFARGRECIMVSGTADPFMTPDGIRQMEEDEKVRLLLFENANHSLENPADTCESVSNLEMVVKLYDEVYGE